jgi:superfamily I DNA/RNA helicase
VGIGTCVSLGDKILVNNLNFKDQFGPGQTAAVFTGRENNAINEVKAIINAMAGWDIADLLGQRSGDIGTIIGTHLSQSEANSWLTWSAQLPTDTTLEELEAILGSRSVKDARQVLFDIFSRLNQPMPANIDPSGRVRVMTLHSSKGLGAKVVFIPGLEEQLLPGPYRAPFAGQVQEAARLLYVGITRARADCVISFAHRRFINGRTVVHQPSRFAANFGIAFNARTNGLTPGEINNILANCVNL